MSVGKGPLFCQSAQLQINGGEPPLAGGNQLIRLCIRKGETAACGIGGELFTGQPKLLCFDPVKAASQAHDLAFRKKAVASGGDDMDILWKAVRQMAEKTSDARIRQQVKVIQEEITGLTSGQRMVQLIRQKSG